MTPSEREWIQRVIVNLGLLEKKVDEIVTAKDAGRFPAKYGVALNLVQCEVADLERLLRTSAARAVDAPEVIE